MTCIYGPQGITAMVAKEQIIIATVPVGCGPIVSNQWVGLSFLITPNPPSPSHPEREREREVYNWCGPHGNIASNNC